LKILSQEFKKNKIKNKSGLVHRPVGLQLYGTGQTFQPVFKMRGGTGQPALCRPNAGQMQVEPTGPTCIANLLLY